MGTEAEGEEGRVVGQVQPGDAPLGGFFRLGVKRGQCVKMSRAELQTRGIVSANALKREKDRLG